MTTALPRYRSILQKPLACPETVRLVDSLVSITQAPSDLVLMSVLSSYSTLLQGMIDVERPEAGVGPVSLFTLTIAASGERKSTVSRLLDKPIQQFQQEESSSYLQKCLEFEIDSKIVNQEQKRLQKEISKQVQAGECIEELKQQLMALIEGKSQRPLKTQLLFEDTTTEAIAEALHQGFGNAALTSGEGASILNGRIVQDLPRLNKLWSAENFTVNRKTSDSFTVENARLSLAIMAQPSAIQRFMKKRGDESIGIGFLARFLVCFPESKQGQRFIETRFPEEDEGYENYLIKTGELLENLKAYIDNPTLERKRMCFDLEAKKYWVNLYNSIESELSINGYFQFAQDHGSKLAENIARIAALLSYIELGAEQPVSLSILKDAEMIARYFSDTYLECFESQPDFIKDAIALSEYLQVCREDGYRYIRKNKIRQSGPNRLRKKSNLDDAVSMAIQYGEISVTSSDYGMLAIDLYPGRRPDQAMWDEFLSKNSPATKRSSL